eukprot:RCo044469
MRICGTTTCVKRTPLWCSESLREREKAKMLGKVFQPHPWRRGNVPVDVWGDPPSFPHLCIISVCSVCIHRGEAREGVCRSGGEEELWWRKGKVKGHEKAIMGRELGYGGGRDPPPSARYWKKEGGERFCHVHFGVSALLRRFGGGGPL